MSGVWVAIAIAFVVAVFLAVLIWFLITQCRQQRNKNRKIVQRPASSTQGANSNASAPYFPFNSPYPPNRPPLGFGDPISMPQPDLHNMHRYNANNHLNTYPPKSQKTPHPLHSENHAPYPTETSCCPPATPNTAPYPIDSSMPQPSSSRNAYYSDGNICESSNSIRITPYPPTHNAPYPPSDARVMPQLSTSRNRRFLDNTTNKMPSYNRRVLYPPESSAPYPPLRRYPYPPVGSAEFSLENSPPTYQDTLTNKL